MWKSGRVYPVNVAKKHREDLAGRRPGVQGTGQPHGGAATSALLTALLLSADSRAVSGTFKTDLPKGAFSCPSSPGGMPAAHTSEVL